MNIIKKGKEGKDVEIEYATIFSLFYGQTILQLFYTNLKVLNKIKEKLEMSEFEMEQDNDENQLENQTLRRLYFILSNHQKGQQK